MLIRERSYKWLPHLIILMTVVILWIGAVAIHYVKKRAVATAGENLTLAAADAADKLDLLLFERYGDIQIMTKAAVFQGRDRTAMTEYLMALRKAYPVYLWLAVTDANGWIVAATDPASMGKDRSSQAWFQAVRKKIGVHVQDAEPSDEAGKELAIAFSAPIVSPQGEFLGAVTTRVGLTTLEKVFERTVHAVQAQPDTSAMIEWQFMTQDGDVIADSLLKEEGKVNFKRLGIPSILFSDSAEPGYVEERHLRRDVSVVTGYAQTKGMGDFPGLRWKVLARMAHSDILAPLHRILWNLGVAGSFVFLPVLGLLFWTTGRLRKEWAYAQESREWLTTTLKSIGDGVIAADKNGCIVFMNGVAQSMTGWKEEEATGKALEEVFHIVNEKTGLPAENPVNKVIREGRVIGLGNHTILIAKDGTRRSIADSAAPITEGNGNFIGVVLVFYDITERVRAQERLERLSHRYQLLLDSAGEGIYGVDLEGNTTLVNPAAVKMIGYTYEEVIGRSMHAILHHTKPDGTPYPREECQIYKAFQDGAVHHVTDEVFWRKDGTNFPVEYTSTPIWEWGKIAGAVVMFRDITERKQAEEALRRAEENYRSIIENALDGIFQTTPKGRYLSVNPALARMYGYDSPQDLMANITDIERQVYVDPGRRIEFIRLLVEHGVVRGFESQVYRKDGSVIWISEHVRGVRDEHGKLLYYEGIIEDVTERKRAEEKLILYQEIFANSSDGIAIIDPQGHYLEQNVAHRSLLGYTDDELRGKTPALHLGDAAFLEIAQELERSGHYHGEVISLMKNGGSVNIELSAFTVRDKAGDPVCYVGIKRDITERKRAEAQLQSSFDLLRKLSRRLEAVREEERTRIAREIHDELGVVLTCLKLDLSRLNGSVSMVDKLAVRQLLEDKILSMIQLIDPTIALVQRIVTELRPGVLDDLGLVAAIEWQAQDFQKRTGIVCTFISSVDEIKIEREQATAMFRICQEALTNVARHAHATSVAIRLEDMAGYLRLEVKDNGQGVTEQKISDPQSLGLLGMRERAGCFGGEVSIKGVPGKGTTLTLRVPRQQPG